MNPIDNSDGTAPSQAISLALSAENASETLRQAMLDFLRQALARSKTNGPTQTQRDADKKLRERRKAEAAPHKAAKSRDKSKARSKRYRDRQKLAMAPAPAVRPIAKAADHRALALALKTYIATGNRQAQQLGARAGTYLRAYVVLLDLRAELGADPKPAALARRYAERWEAPIADWTPPKARMWACNMLSRLRSLEAPGGPWERDANAMKPAEISVTAGDEGPGPSVTQNDEASATMKPHREHGATVYVVDLAEKNPIRDGFDPVMMSQGFIASRHAFSLLYRR